MQSFNRLLFSALFLLHLAACMREEDSLDLPVYEAQPVVECYIEPGKPLTLLLTLSSPFFAPFDTNPDYLKQTTFIDNALIEIEHHGKVDTLLNKPYFDPLDRKYFNYHHPALLEAQPGDVFRLRVRLPENGGDIEGQATLPAIVKLDSVTTDRNNDLERYARVVTWFSDDPNTRNYYHYILNYGNTTDSLPHQDLLLTDEIFQSKHVAVASGYDLKKNGKAFATLFHIAPDYYEFLESLQYALLSTQNPLSQPSKIKSNVHGSANPIGIFTGLAYDRKMVIIE